MTSRFTNLFKSTDLDEQRAFQKRVLDFVIELFPEKSVVAAADPHTITVDEMPCGITNIRSAFLLSSQTNTDLRTIVTEHFRVLSENVQIIEQPSWESAMALLMPQLMPKEFLNKIPLVSFPFGEQIVLGFVIDNEKSYSYVNRDNLDRWDKTEDEIRETALKNLEVRSAGIDMTAIPPPGGLVVINTMDSYDAARITSTAIQDFIGEILGKPFCFGVPNRDFLICWEKNDDKEYQDRFRSQISQDFDERPYPLSRIAFEVSESNEIIQTGNAVSDPRSTSAEYN